MLNVFKAAWGVRLGGLFGEGAGKDRRRVQASAAGRPRLAAVIRAFLPPSRKAT